MAAALASLFIIEEIERLERIPRRVFRDRSDAFSLKDNIFTLNFRLDKASVLELTSILKPILPSEGLPAHLRVLIALRFFATGCYQLSLANDLFLGVSQVTASRCIEAVSMGIADMLMHEIQFPTLPEQQEIKKRFLAATHLEGVIGAIDCTHVRIIAPSENSLCVKDQSYVNKKGVHSISVQLIVDDLLNIRNINARFLGSVDDAFIWKNSAVRDFLSAQYENGDQSSWLVGDSNYPLEPWLLIPYPNPVPGSQEFKFNELHASARHHIDRCNGILKYRFRCLHRVLRYHPTKASFIIIACSILHNICNKKKIGINYEDEIDAVDSFDEEEEDEDEPPYTSELSQKLVTTAEALRDNIALNL